MILSCPECNGKVSTEATKCPHCGAPRKLWASMSESGDVVSSLPPSSPVVSAPLPQPSPQENHPSISVDEKPRFWRRLMPRRRAARVIVVNQPRMLADKVISPGRTFQHSAAGGFGFSFGWAMGGCAAMLVIALMLTGAAYGIYLYTTRHAVANQGNPLPMEKKVHGANRCPRCDGIGFVEAQGDGVGMKCPRCSGTGFR